MPTQEWAAPTSPTRHRRGVGRRAGGQQAGHEGQAQAHGDGRRSSGPGPRPVESVHDPPGMSQVQWPAAPTPRTADGGNLPGIGRHRSAILGPVEWPEGFLWGTGASSTQCEGAAPASDWWAWERRARTAVRRRQRVRHPLRRGLRLLAALGLTHHRLSLEWARLEPEPGVHDPAAVAPLPGVLRAALDAGVAPWVTLHHFTLPQWFLDAGGFAVEANRVDTWRRHVDFVAETFGDLVAGWQPVNEVNYYARAAYGGRGWPPGRHDRAETAVVDEAIHLANAEAAVRLRHSGAPVASIFGLSPVVAMDDEPSTRSTADALIAYHWTPWVGLVRDGVLARAGPRPRRTPGPGRLRRRGRLLVLRHHGRPRADASPCTRTGRPVAAGLRDLGRRARAGPRPHRRRAARHARSWSPSTGSGPTTTGSGPPTCSAASR